MNQTYVFTIQKNLAYVMNWYWHLNLVISGERLSNFHVGATDVVPRDQQHMTSSEFNLRRCGFYEGAVPNNITVRIECPRGLLGVIWWCNYKVPTSCHSVKSLPKQVNTGTRKAYKSMLPLEYEKAIYKIQCEILGIKIGLPLLSRPEIYR